ncbi:MAG: MIP family channel protein [Candidatus Acidiferrales bacterium]
MYGKSQKLLAEFVGTFALIFFGAGSICTAHFLNSSSQVSVGLLGIAVAHGLAIGIMVTAVGHISGGHFNPAVTIGFWVTRRLSSLDTILYWIAQLAGAAAAAYLLRYLIPEDTWRAAVLGAPDLAHDMTRTSGMIIEGVLTFFLVFVVFATAVDARGAFNKIAGFAIGLTITMDILMGGPFTGAAMNPARAFGPELAARYWHNAGVYWVGPLLGGVLAASIYDVFYLKKE